MLERLTLTQLKAIGFALEFTYEKHNVALYRGCKLDKLMAKLDVAITEAQDEENEKKWFK